MWLTPTLALPTRGREAVGLDLVGGSPSPLWGGNKGGGCRKLGRTKIELGQKISHDAVEVACDFGVGNAEDLVALGYDEGVASVIVGDRVVAAVGVAVDLNDELEAMAREVGVIRAQWYLAAEVMAEGFEGAQGVPHRGFGDAHGFAE
ncbi:hypothetical protein JP74_11875 [Devosia sp. 17-2-E-8]|nr:hypothetical protein JP74_11875 [Devosia sp. 17-2-E-8]